MISHKECVNIYHVLLFTANRQISNLDDLAMAFDHFNINMTSLQDFHNEVDHIPFPHDVPQFPVRCCNNKHLHESATPTTSVQVNSDLIGENYDDDEDDEEVWSPLIPSYLPPLPTKEADKGECYVAFCNKLID